MVGSSVSLGGKQSSTRRNALSVLQAYGLDAASISPVFLDPGEAALALEDSLIDATFIMGAEPISVLQQLAKRTSIRLLPIEEEHANKIISDYRYMQQDAIDAGTYARNALIRTISLPQAWIINEQADEELVFDLTRALWLTEGLRDIIPDALHDTANLAIAEGNLAFLPVHQGAKHFYLQNTE
ncbi:MAG: TAXI family TRAP transporter solute-binding subunit [Pseudomonadota bacterium]